MLKTTPADASAIPKFDYHDLIALICVSVVLLAICVGYLVAWLHSGRKREETELDALMSNQDVDEDWTGMSATGKRVPSIKNMEWDNQSLLYPVPKPNHMPVLFAKEQFDKEMLLDVIEKDQHPYMSEEPSAQDEMTVSRHDILA